MQGSALFYRGAQISPNEWRESLKQARALFDRALQIDPNDADALAGSAGAYFNEYFNGWTDPQTDYEAKILGQADRAIALAPDNVGAYFEKAQYLGLVSHRYSEALGVTDAGLAVNPNFAPLYIPRTVAENSLGRFEQAKADAERAMQLSPRDPLIGLFHVDAGDAEISLGHFDAAIDEYRKAIELRLSRVFRLHEPVGRLCSCRQDGGSEDRFGRSAPSQSRNHGQMDEGAYAEPSGRVRRIAQGGTAGGMKQV